MGHPAGQAAHRLDLLRLPQLLFQLPALGDVAEDGQVAAGQEVAAGRELQLPHATVGADDAQLALRPAVPAEGRPRRRHVVVGGHEVPDPVAEQGGAVEAVQAAGGGVGLHAPALVVGDHHRVEGAVEHGPELARRLPHRLLRALALGHVAVVDDHRAHRRLGEMVGRHQLHQPPASVAVARPHFDRQRRRGAVQAVGEERAEPLRVVGMDELEDVASFPLLRPPAEQPAR